MIGFPGNTIMLLTVRLSTSLRHKAYSYYLASLALFDNLFLILTTAEEYFRIQNIEGLSKNLEQFIGNDENAASFLLLSLNSTVPTIENISEWLTSKGHLANSNILSRFSSIECKIWKLAASVTPTLCSWFITCLSVERFVMIYMPFHRRLLCRRRNAIFVIIGLITCAVVFHSYELAMVTQTGDLNADFCAVSEEYVDIVVWLTPFFSQICLQLLIPITIIISCNVLVILKTSKMSSQRDYLGRIPTNRRSRGEMSNGSTSNLLNRRKSAVDGSSALHRNTYVSVNSRANQSFLVSNERPKTMNGNYECGNKESYLLSNGANRPSNISYQATQKSDVTDNLAFHKEVNSLLNNVNAEFGFIDCTESFDSEQIRTEKSPTSILEMQSPEKSIESFKYDRRVNRYSKDHINHKNSRLHEVIAMRQDTNVQGPTEKRKKTGLSTVVAIAGREEISETPRTSTPNSVRSPEQRVSKEPFEMLRKSRMSLPCLDVSQLKGRKLSSINDLLIRKSLSEFSSIFSMRRGNDENSLEQTRRKVTRILLCITFVFVMCNVPLITLILYELFFTKDIVEQQLSISFLLIKCMAEIFTLASCSLNFVIYLLWGKTYRVEMWNLFRAKNVRQNRRDCFSRFFRSNS